MEPKKVVRYLTLPIETRKEILKIPYCTVRDKGKGKRIELWINIEMLARLLELKERNEVDEVKSEHKYPLPKISAKKGCDLWWKKDNEEHWLEVKTVVFHCKSDGLRDKYKERIKKDLKKADRLKSPYNFHHLLMIFDDECYSTGKWMEDIYAIYQDYQMKEEDKWKFNVEQGKTVYVFLHYKSADNQ